ncbi:hypothetical protein RHMOL_Rhmol06G0173900 [Rhododendron molle]|nr:hypothetical protein RHMOL_Rhmol06G0173900 [Rhododendron molle]
MPAAKLSISRTPCISWSSIVSGLTCSLLQYIRLISGCHAVFSLSTHHERSRKGILGCTVDDLVSTDVEGNNSCNSYTKFSFGVVLLELIADRKPMDKFGDGVDIVRWVKKTISELAQWMSSIGEADMATGTTLKTEDDAMESDAMSEPAINLFDEEEERPSET